FGVECEEISPARAGELFPPLRTDDLHGAIWIPGDGKANPADLTMSLAKGARMRGVKIVEETAVLAVRTAHGPSGPRVTGLLARDDGGTHEIACEVVVNCAGQWARQFGELAGVNVPLWSAEHFYIVTDRIDGVHPMLPVMRDPDGFIYYKEEVGGLLMGGFEPKAKPWTVDPIPATFRFELLGEDWEQFEPLMHAAIHRTPCLETAQVKMLLNGPESFTPDGNFILGEAPELRNFFVSAGFNSAGIANSGGAGKLIAEWIVAGTPQSDLSDVDIRRFGAFTANKTALAARTGETLGLHYAMRWPRQELETARLLRTSPLYDLLAAKGAVFGSKNGWERANYFVSENAGGDPARPNVAHQHTLGKPRWLRHVIDEQRATREAVAVYDQTSFGKLLLQGRDALALLQRLCANEMDVPVGKMVYTPMLNERGGYESDVTITRLGPQTFLVVTGSAQATRDTDWIARHTRANEHAALTDVSGMVSVLSVMGPNARALLARTGSAHTAAALGAEQLRFAHTLEIDVGFARIRAARMSYVGGPGFELYVPIEMARHVWLALHEAGEGLGLIDAGYYALDALRIEAGRRAWGADIGPDDTPFEAGQMFAVKLDKASDFIGKTALLGLRDQPLHRKLVTVVFDAPEDYAWGGEVLTVDGKPVGELTSVGWSPKAGRCVGLGYLRGNAAAVAHAGTAIEVELWGEPVRAAAWDRWPPAA
ncbi:MAG: FAD-dependent oxidoreductase, partial [Caldimonas sp.]